MAKWTLNSLGAHRDHIINKHYRHYGSAVVLSMYSRGGEDETILHAYPSVTLDRPACRLSEDQVDHFMSSTEFDKPLFETLTIELGIHADTALMMSLS